MVFITDHDYASDGDQRDHDAAGSFYWFMMVFAEDRRVRAKTPTVKMRLCLPDFDR